MKTECYYKSGGDAAHTSLIGLKYLVELEIIIKDPNYRGEKIHMFQIDLYKGKFYDIQKDFSQACLHFKKALQNYIQINPDDK